MQTRSKRARIECSEIEIEIEDSLLNRLKELECKCNILDCEYDKIIKSQKQLLLLKDETISKLNFMLMALIIIPSTILMMSMV